ncbi:uncharacterized protein LOC127259369 [Andrographis paniculata]|uniref:uncharacterized protein LOC127259369 n=1 Tax=Andrographis paniculata TaxID=175694 RepID=UPI0021E8ACDD|nr:uncharacterized protein LOC127259369 [Andrographis paniculata]
MFKRSEKKIKAVFKMDFSASQVPQLKAKSLMISLVPVDVGKPTVRLAKAPIIEGACIWESPVYETVKLVMETKTGRIREKFYYVIVSTGSSKSGFLGEVSIDFADLAHAAKPVNLTLPLQTSKSGAILHVTVQKMQGGVDSRYDEDSEVPGDESYDQNVDADSYGKSDPLSLESDESSQVSSRDEQNGSLEKDKVKMLERNIELTELEVQSLRKQILKETKKGQQLTEQIACIKEERDALQAECEQLKSLCRQNDETVSSHALHETENSRSSLEKLKQDLQREKQLNKKLKFQLQKSEDSNSEYVLAMRDLTKKLEQKNADIAQRSRKSNDLHSGTEALAKSSMTKAPQDLSSSNRNADEIEALKQKIEDLNSEIEVYKKEKTKMQLEVERYLQDMESLDTENENIYSKLEQAEKEHLEVKSKYEELLAEAKQSKLQIASLEAENKRQARQHSESLNMIDELESQVESLLKELEKQGQDFEEDLQVVTEEKVEQEKRAIQAEEALRKTRRDNANTVERLQEEIKHISAEMSTEIEENKKIAQKAMAEADGLRQKNELLEEQLQITEEELQLVREQDERLLQEHSEKNEWIAASNGKSNKDISEQMQNSNEKDKEDLEKQLASVRKEAEKLKSENNSMKSQIDQKKTKEENLYLEVKKLRLKNSEVKNQLHAVEMEKEDLKKEMSKAQRSLIKAQEEEKAARQNYTTLLMKEKNGVTDNSKQDSGPMKDKNFVELEGLKERNKSMEQELKEMRDRYSEISLRFAEVEGERQQLVMTIRNLKSGKKN